MSEKRRMIVENENIPVEMKEWPHWVAWKRVPKENEKFSKIPIDPKTGRYASVSDPKTWGTLQQVLNYLNKHDDLSGIGFVFSKG